MKSLLLIIVLMMQACGAENGPKEQAYNDQYQLVDASTEIQECQNGDGYIVYWERTKQYYTCMSDGWHIVELSPDGKDVSAIY